VGPRKQYLRFVKICNLEKISCKNLITIIMYEYIDDDSALIVKNNLLSFRGFLKENLFDLLDHDIKVNPENIFFPDPADLSQIGEIIKEIGGVDICFGGVGINGHIAFNEAMDKKPTPNFPASFLKLHRNASITVSKNVLKDYIEES
jgi:glucosamine-6-phosphate deaminase